MKSSKKEYDRLYYLRPEVKARRRVQQKQWKDKNNARARAQYRKWRAEDPRKAMVGKAKDRAREKKLPFSITVDDVTMVKTCPILGVPLVVAEGRAKMNSPALDRIVPKLGYVPGNVRVISQRANLMKRDLTEEDLLMLLQYVRGER